MSRNALGALAVALIAFALFAIRPPSEPGPHFRDFEAYYAAGRAMNAGTNPYAASLFDYEKAVPGVDAHRFELLPFVGAPPANALWSALARANYDAASRLWLAVLCLGVGALVFAALGFCATSRPFDAANALLCALSFVPLTSGIVLGQPMVVAAAAVSLGILALPRSIPLAVLATIAGTLQPVMLVPAASFAGVRRGLVALAIAFAAIYALGAASASPQWPLTYAELLRAHAGAERVIAIQYTPAAVLFALGLSETTATIAGIAFAAVALAVTALGIAKTNDAVRRFSIVCAALPIASGFVHEHNFVPLFVPALWAARSFSTRTQGAVVLAFGLIAVNWMDFAQQPAGAAQDVVLGLGALAAILAWQRERSLWSYGAALAVTFTIALGAWVGAHHPAPIWPNDMQAFHVPAGAAAAYVWHVEQIRSGLERVEPAWGLLRSFSLAGSIVLLAVLSFGKRLNIDVHEVVERRDRVGTEVF